MASFAAVGKNERRGLSAGLSALLKTKQNERVNFKKLIDGGLPRIQSSAPSSSPEEPVCGMLRTTQRQRKSRASGEHSPTESRCLLKDRVPKLVRSPFKRTGKAERGAAARSGLPWTPRSTETPSAWRAGARDAAKIHY
jgi:hypothetical protein